MIAEWKIDLLLQTDCYYKTIRTRHSTTETKADDVTIMTDERVMSLAEQFVAST